MSKGFISYLLHRLLLCNFTLSKITTNNLNNYNMITADQLKDVLEREHALRGYL